MEQDLNLLIVDDDEVDIQSVVRAVRRAGLPFGLYTAHEGQRAMDILRDEKTRQPDKPFLILLDLNMPGLSGFEFLERLREDQAIRDSIVFVLTTSNHEKDRDRAYEHLVAGYLVKSDLAPNYSSLVSLLKGYASAVSFPAARTP